MTVAVDRCFFYRPRRKEKRTANETNTTAIRSPPSHISSKSSSISPRPWNSCWASSKDFRMISAYLSEQGLNSTSNSKGLLTNPSANVSSTQTSGTIKLPIVASDGPLKSRPQSSLDRRMGRDASAMQLPGVRLRIAYQNFRPHSKT